MEFKRSNNNRGRGFTLVEMMVAVAIGCLLLAALATIYVFSMKSFGAMANYSDLNQKSRYASDIVSRDIRCALKVVSASTTSLVLSEPDPTTGTTTVTYTYDDVAGTLSKIMNGQTNVLLSGVGSCSFALKTRPYVTIPPTSPYDANGNEQFPDALPDGSDAKLVAFQWSCSRTLGGSLNNSESLEAAMVELRNK
jgi:prepilin-type N-terminal cleavage/methylation domain-containing protein